MRLPIGSSLGQKRRAIVSLITATRRSRRCVLICKISPTQKRNGHRVEIPGTDHSGNNYRVPVPAADRAYPQCESRIELPWR